MATATRLYFDGTTVPDLPAGWAFPATSGGVGSWSSYTQAVTRTLNVGAAGTSAYSNLAASSTSSEDVLVAQYVALVGSGMDFLAGTDLPTMQLLSSYTGASPVDTVLVAMAVVSLDGTTIRADLTAGPLDMSSGTPLNLSTKKNHTWITSGSSYSSSYTTQGPEWLVVELGFAATAASSAITASLRFGEGSGSGSDLAVNETATADGIPWLQHSSAGDQVLRAAGCLSEANGGNVRLW